ncbi:MAG TPA: radical SAM protein [Anaerovoracaceae bacterium]|nr:radical SAM protein [Anaerovoracaceae bacterium]
MKKVASLSMKNTYSVCPVCLERIPAKLINRGGCWYMEKVCEHHGKYKTVVWRGTSPSLRGWGNYHPPKENEESLPHCPKDCGLCDNHLQSTCCILVEVTDRCNLRCPICFAQSGNDDFKGEKSVEALFEDFDFLVKKGCKFIQLSGGEPTVRDDLPEIVSAAKRAGATSVQLNSNGLRLGKEPGFTKRLAEAGLDFVFMQFDGLDDEVYSALRGNPLLKEKLEAIMICGENGIGVTLVPTVVPNVNDHQIGAIISFGMKNSPVVRGVHFQPISYFGRYPEPPKDENRITMPEIVAAIEQQTEGLIRQTDLAPSSCDHPRCGFHGDFVIMPDKLISLTPKGAASASSDCCCNKTTAERAGNYNSDDEALRNRNFVARRWKRNLSLEKVAADDAGATDPADIPDFDTFLARVAANGFTVTGMAFQDAYNLDVERLRRCSLHVYEHGRIVPFCAKYLTGI